MNNENRRRVVVTGMGVLAPNAHGVENFEHALRAGISGIRVRPGLAELGFTCQVAGIPERLDELRDRYFDPVLQLGMDRYAVLGSIAALDCWHDAGLPINLDAPDWDASIFFGSGIGGVETTAKILVPMTDAARVRRMGSAIPESGNGQRCERAHRRVDWRRRTGHEQQQRLQHVHREHH